MYSLRDSFDELRLHFTQAVADIRLEPRKSAVHNVRTLSRRMEALLRKTLEDHPDAQGLQQQTPAALKLLTKIRRLAGPVRDFDVALKLTAACSRSTLVGSSLRKRKAVERDTIALNLDLGPRREKAARRLQKALTKKELALDKALQATAAAMDTLTVESTAPLATAQHWIERSMASIGPLTVKNLHDLRKQTKSARYVAELQPGSKAARLFARTVHTLQQSIGKWHDYELLTEEAADVLGKKSPLTQDLRAKADASLASALRRAQKPFTNPTTVPVPKRSQPPRRSARR